ncbi:phospholipase D family protein [Christiangramia crocea]|uniref:Phospholipase D family protein n=1 Tax=Christiangramia crocea TaxID=2904124 RepID=A0A9X2A7T9_9FLAO|nr:phospholipase D family protein [Gramella crocea]MCG9971163.1 phospholipase D family protein [Gramella crocea]
MEIYLKNWYDKFIQELPKTKNLRIISPFVGEQILRKIEKNFNFQNFELITRYNLQDFALKVSSLDGIKFSVNNGAHIYGIKGLHSKVYLLDKRAAIITSANLTNGGLRNNMECGIYLTDKKVIADLHNHFKDLKNIAGKKLEINECLKWESKLSNVNTSKGKAATLPDYGSTKSNFNSSINYFIKFFGKADNRVELDFPVKEEIDRALCHYACGFPINKKPRQVKDGDIIYMARMTENPNDYAIFGKATALKFKEGRDIASDIEKHEREWKKKWPVYLRVENPIFLNGTMSDGILLSDLMEKFEYDSFPSTRKRYDNGERDIEVKRSLMRKAYTRITHNSANWLDQQFEDALQITGKVPGSFLKKLPQTTTNLNDW